MACVDSDGRRDQIGCVGRDDNLGTVVAHPGDIRRPVRGAIGTGSLADVGGGAVGSVAKQRIESVVAVGDSGVQVGGFGVKSHKSPILADFEDCLTSGARISGTKGHMTKQKICIVHFARKMPKHVSK